MELHLTPLQLTDHDDKRPIVIAGPCSAETEEQVMNTATQLAKKGLNSSALASGSPAPSQEVSKALANQAWLGSTRCKRRQA